MRVDLRKGIELFAAPMFADPLTGSKRTGLLICSRGQDLSPMTICTLSLDDAVTVHDMLDSDAPASTRRFASASFHGPDGIELHDVFGKSVVYRIDNLEEFRHSIRMQVSLPRGGDEPGATHSDSKVDHPAHYGGKDNPYEAIRVIRAWRLGFALGNAVKYIARAGKKSGESAVDDLRKAVWYLQNEIDELLKKDG